MKLKWYGHASFRITAVDGTTIVTDPYTPELAGYRPFTEPADIAIASSDDDDYHCRTDLIPGDPVRINALEIAKAGGSREVNGITFTAIITKEMEDHPYHAPGQNAMYRFEKDGIKVAHMGDIGNPFTQTQIDFLKGADVLLTLAGDVPTIKLVDLVPALEEIAPKLIVPMHFRTLTYRPRDGFWIQSFLDYYDNDKIDFVFDYETNLTPADIPDHTRVLVFDYVR
jgi:L-ascorbate metabolism protein UlaG (beta-lactamase superfamily)